ncbi:mitogen-activated protein kinase kinase kinase 5-like [Paramacrobiotus metropolitanus]|uniref:mitogen-activated protein kinase kinase kinase 5-like n=1 Tax=Paramacrobiotus metropolitanus TaxID=2943436 RepID=UPI00244629BF|nr:mitogen-activated protein kinase kinase kinase 5-like [Paramacrobiotus metropolitanus]
MSSVYAVGFQYKFSSPNSTTYSVNVERKDNTYLPKKDDLKLSGDHLEKSGFDGLENALALPQKAELTTIASDRADAQNEIQALRAALLPLVTAFAKEHHNVNVQRYYGVDYTSGKAGLTRTCYILAEHCPGMPLDELMRSVTVDADTKINDFAVIIYTRQILKGLNFLHENHIIHRDIKGSNVMVNEATSTVKIKGLLMAKHFSGDSTPSNCLENAAGTVPFLSPEMASLSAKRSNQHTSVGRKTDIWSLGCTVIQMLQQGTPPRLVRDKSGDTVVPTASTHNFKDMHYYFGVGYRPQYPTADICGHGCTESCSLVTTDVIAFLNKCLEKDPVNRPLCTALLQMKYFARTMPNHKSREMQRCVVRRYEIDSVAQVEDTEEAKRNNTMMNYLKKFVNLTISKETRDELDLLKTTTNLPGTVKDHKIPYTVTFISPAESPSGNSKFLMANKGSVFEKLTHSSVLTSEHIIKHLAAVLTLWP